MKEELFKKAKEHLNYLDQVLKENKKERRKQRGHLIHNKYDNLFLGPTSFVVAAIGIAALFLLYLRFPLGLSISIGCSTSFLGTFILPRIIHFSILKFAKGKLGRGYAKLEVDNHLKVMKGFYKKYYSNLIKAKSSEHVSDSELKAFSRQIAIFAKNGKENLDKGICKKIVNRNKKDLHKIELLAQKYSDNRALLEEKVNKIVKKNNKFTKPWCEVYNKCAARFRDFYHQANSINENIIVPDDREFGLNYQGLQNMIANHVDKSLVVTQKAFNPQTIANDRRDEEIRKYRESMQNRNKTYNEDMTR